jgi:hypothetical protein
VLKTKHEPFYADAVAGVSTARLETCRCSRALTVCWRSREMDGATGWIVRELYDSIPNTSVSQHVL